MVRATVQKIAPVLVPANVIAEPADLLLAVVAVEKRKAVVPKVADKVVVGKVVNVAPVVREADWP